MLKQQKYGGFINFSTIAVPLALRGESVYVASKAGVEGFSRSFAKRNGELQHSCELHSPRPNKYRPAEWYNRDADRENNVTTDFPQTIKNLTYVILLGS